MSRYKRIDSGGRFKNNLGQAFSNISSEVSLESDSLSNGSAWGDFNNDGYLDIWAANIKNEDDLYLNSGDGDWDDSYTPFFQSATQDVIPADYNNDGWLDVFAPGLQMIGGGNGPKYTSLLYKNISPDSLSSINKWLKLDLEGAMVGVSNSGWSNSANRSAVGARVIVHLPDKNISREVIAGKGHGSMDPLQLHFGLGQFSTIDSITIKWPSRNFETNQPKIVVYPGPVEANNRYTIFENISHPFIRSKGDTNNDSIVNVLDVLLFVNFFFEGSFNDEESWAADMNSDNFLDITDIVFLVNFIFVH